MNKPVRRSKSLRTAAALLSMVMLTAVSTSAITYLFDNVSSIAVLSAAMQQPAAAMRYISQWDSLSEPLFPEAPSSSANATTAPSETEIETETETTSPTTGTTVTTPSAVIPPREDGGGTVTEMLIGGGADPVNGVSVRNKSGKTFDLKSELSVLPNLSLTKTDEPQVLLIHTHTTECYMSYFAGYYNPSDPTRTLDESLNVCAVGEAIAEPLEQAGIGVIHDTAVHDSPQYSGAYARSEETVKKNLERYPSIRVVLDIHRDCVMLNDTDKAKPTVLIDGKKAAQIMIIAGVVSTEDLPNPFWEENFHFALQLQKRMSDTYGDLIRPLSLVASRYNQHLTSGYLLVEVGTDANTLDEAVYSGQLLGTTLAKLLQDWMG